MPCLLCMHCSALSWQVSTPVVHWVGLRENLPETMALPYLYHQKKRIINDNQWYKYDIIHYH